MAAALSGCWKLVGPGAVGTIDVAPPGADHVRMVYLGVGGWIIERGSDQVLGAPLFSNPSLFRTGLAPIRSDTAVVNRWMAPHDVHHAAAILVGHGHYDHLMDVPQVALRHAPRARILANRTSRNLLGSWSGVTDRVVVVNDSAGGPETPGRWIRVSPGVRVLPLRSHHAPHFLGLTFYAGSRERPATEPPERAEDWVAGETFAFLVDFLDAAGAPVFRVYYSDAVAQAPLGLPAPEVLEDRRVDVAILVPSTFDQVDWHPEAPVEALRPRWVLLGHWESFFGPLEEDRGAIAFTDYGHFEDRLDRTLDGRWWRPNIGAEFRFPLLIDGSGGG